MLYEYCDQIGTGHFVTNREICITCTTVAHFVCTISFPSFMCNKVWKSNFVNAMIFKSKFEFFDVIIRFANVFYNLCDACFVVTIGKSIMKKKILHLKSFILNNIYIYPLSSIISTISYGIV